MAREGSSHPGDQNQRATSTRPRIDPRASRCSDPTSHRRCRRPRVLEQTLKCLWIRGVGGRVRTSGCAGGPGGPPPPAAPGAAAPAAAPIAATPVRAPASPLRADQFRVEINGMVQRRNRLGARSGAGFLETGRTGLRPEHAPIQPDYTCAPAGGWTRGWLRPWRQRRPYESATPVHFRRVARKRRSGAPLGAHECMDHPSRLRRAA